MVKNTKFASHFNTREMKKVKRNIRSLFFILVGALLLSSCTKNDDNTIVLIGEEFYIDDILTVIPDTLKPAFDAVFGDIPQGAVPPKIEGSCVVDTKERVYSNVSTWPLSVLEPNVYLRFSWQHNGVAQMDLNEATEQYTDTVFVMGNHHDFTVYYVENKAYKVPFNGHNYHVKVKRGIIMTGTVGVTGYGNFKIASVIMEADDDSNGILSQYAPGSFFIYKDGDGVAEYLDW